MSIAYKWQTAIKCVKTLWKSCKRKRNNQKHQGEIKDLQAKKTKQNRTKPERNLKGKIHTSLHRSSWRKAEWLQNKVSILLNVNIQRKKDLAPVLFYGYLSKKEKRTAQGNARQLETLGSERKACRYPGTITDFVTEKKVTGWARDNVLRWWGWMIKSANNILYENQEARKQNKWGAAKLFKGKKDF